mmetsp:Transcript_40566/g.87869  ORF Transcript_40566/g.87869 Transcript_40566/m.87869 type:complete len:201 (-) Transcript_40566:14-616(-)
MLRVLALVQEIFQFQVPVHYLTSMQICYSQKNLSDAQGCSFLRVALATGEAFVELPTRHVFHHKVHLLVSFVDHFQLRHMGVVQGKVDLRLALQLRTFAGGHALLLETLDGILQSVSLAGGQAHRATEATTNDFTVKMIVVLQMPAAGVSASNQCAVATSCQDLVHLHHLVMSRLLALRSSCMSLSHGLRYSRQTPGRGG